MQFFLLQLVLRNSDNMIGNEGSGTETSQNANSNCIGSPITVHMTLDSVHLHAGCLPSLLVAFTWAGVHILMFFDQMKQRHSSILCRLVCDLLNMDTTSTMCCYGNQNSSSK